MSSLNELNPINSKGSNQKKALFIKIAFLNVDEPCCARLKAIFLWYYIIATPEEPK
jgi:hypothetical protein